jgi:hypothetical protein
LAFIIRYVIIGTLFEIGPSHLINQTKSLPNQRDPKTLFKTTLNTQTRTSPTGSPAKSSKKKFNIKLKTPLIFYH